MRKIPFDHSYPTLSLDNVEYDYFGGCGYHCLQDNEEVRLSAIKALENYPIKQGPSLHISGFSCDLVTKLKDVSSSFFGTDTVILMPTGYFGNTVLLRGLRDDYDVIFMDEHSHYSIQDAIDLAKKPFYTFKHCDPQDLKEKVKLHAKDKVPLIITDGCLPWTGDIPPIPDYISVLEEIGSKKPYFVCDDSHATGVVGPHGRGAYDYHGYSPKEQQELNLYFCGTLSKALGTHGGIIPASIELEKKCIANEHLLRGTTPAAYPVVAASTKSFELLQENLQWISNVHGLSLRLKQGLVDLGFNIKITPVPICGLQPIDDRMDMIHLTEYLRKHQVIVNYRPKGQYTGMDTDMVRFAIFSQHQVEQIDRVLVLLRKYIEVEY